MLNNITLDTVKEHIAEIFEMQLGLPRERVLAGEAFVDLDPNFDSLSLVQAQLFLEEMYETKFERTGAVQLESLPANINELGDMVYPMLMRLMESKREGTV
jgi:acyl carrier protein